MTIQTVFAPFACARLLAVAGFVGALAFGVAQAAPADPGPASTFLLASRSNPAKVRYSIVRIDKFNADETPVLLKRIAAAHSDVELRSYPFISADGPSTYVVIGGAQPRKVLTVVDEVAKVGMPSARLALAY